MAVTKAESCKWLVLVAASCAFGLIMLDETVVAVALPTIQHDLSMSLVMSHWVINAYLLVIAGFVAVGGKLGDITGYRKLFVAGILIFGLSSLACGFAPSSTWLITARAVQGLGASVIFPASMALITLKFPEDQRGIALGIYGAIGSVFIALGPLVGGYFTDVFSWRWIFWINFPVVVLIIGLFLAVWVEPLLEVQRPKIDISGLILLVVGTSSLVLAIMQGEDWGWRSPIIVSLFIAAMVILTAFWIVELRIEQPLIEVDLFGNGTFTASNLVVFTGQFTKIAVIVFGALYLQRVLGMNPLKAGAALLPAMVPIVVTAVLAGRAADRFGPRWPSLLGLLAVAASLVLMGITVDTKSYTLIMLTLILWGAALPFLFPPAMAAVMNSVPAEKQGQAGGIVLTAQIFGATIGLSVMSAVLGLSHSFRAVYFAAAFVVLLVLLIGWVFLEPKPSE